MAAPTKIYFVNIGYIAPNLNINHPTRRNARKKLGKSKYFEAIFFFQSILSRVSFKHIVQG